MLLRWLAPCQTCLACPHSAMQLRDMCVPKLRCTCISTPPLPPIMLPALLQALSCALAAQTCSTLTRARSGRANTQHTQLSLQQAHTHTHIHTHTHKCANTRNLWPSRFRQCTHPLISHTTIYSATTASLLPLIAIAGMHSRPPRCTHTPSSWQPMWSSTWMSCCPQGRRWSCLQRCAGWSSAGERLIEPVVMARKKLVESSSSGLFRLACAGLVCYAQLW